MTCWMIAFFRRSFAAPRTGFLSVVILMATVVVMAPSSPAAAGGPPQRIVIELSDGRGATAADVASDAGGDVATTVMPGVVAVEVPAADADDAVARLEEDPRVRSATPDAVYRIAQVPNDPCYLGCSGYDQYNLRLSNAESAWNVTHGSSGVEVAILDTGVDTTHFDLAGKVSVGSNYSASAASSDVNGHGTHVAGIISANTGNGQGVAGMGWDTRVRSIKVLDDQGAGFASNIAKGVYEALQAGVRVINLSLAGEDAGVLAKAVKAAVDSGVVVVAAAGNESSSTPTFPGAYPGVLAVAASNAADQVSAFSNWGTWVDLAAPGDTILSTFPPGGGCASNCFGIETGTSQSSPIVAGVAALMLAVNPSLSGSTVSSLINSTAFPIAGTGSKVAFGRVDAGKAVQAAINAGTSNPQPTSGYRMVASDGGIFSFGNAAFFGSTGNIRLNQPIVAMAATPTGKGYWMVARDGGIFSFGDARYRGSMAGTPLNGPIVAMAPTLSGNGYWLVGSDGGVYPFGDAPFLGSVNRPNQPIVGMATTATGNGYWLVARDGGIFSFGDAPFLGSTGGITLNKPIVGMAGAVGGNGYWLVASDGGIFSFGSARFFGSTGNIVLNKPIVGMTPNPAGTGYWMVASDGGIFAFGAAPFNGSTGNITLNQPVVGMSL